LRWLFGGEVKDVIHIDNLVEECGYSTSRTTVNNGYGCRHPEQEDVEEEDLDGLREMGVQGPSPFKCGRCFTFTCPLGAELNPSQEEDAETMRECGEDPDSMSDGVWMLVEIEYGRIVGAAPRSDK
jgi:hypothetical protein